LEKFGVDESVNQEELEKKAAEGCPECGAKVERHGNVILCPNCGSAPFEKKEEEKH
jgi:DNA-directed RNA polymerase subunit RPC12/RpoP